MEKRMTYQGLYKLLLREGFIEKRTGKHTIMQKGTAWVSIPIHKKSDMPVGLYKKLLKQANLITPNGCRVNYW